MGMKVFRITSEITRQVFPVLIDIDNPKFKAGLERLLVLNQRIDDADERGGVIGKAMRFGNMAKVAATMIGLYFMPVIRNDTPATSRLQHSF